MIASNSQFQVSSLNRLVKNLSKNDFNYLSQEFDKNILDLVKKKKNNSQAKKKFYSFLTNRKTNQEYEHILNVWNNFKMKTMKDYGDLFLKCDLLFLADVFENVRNDSLKNYGLCLSHYLSAPCLSLDAMFKITKIKLDFIQYPDMFIFFEKGTRGGISYISNRYGTANNKYLKYYDPEEEAKHIIYLD